MGSVGWRVYQLTSENCKEIVNAHKKVENVEKRFLLCEVKF